MKVHNLQMNFIVIFFLLTGFLFSLAQDQPSNQDYTSKLCLKVDTQSQNAKFKIETLLTLLKGITEVELNLKNKNLSVTYDPTQIQEDMMQFAGKSLGYAITNCNDGENKPLKSKSAEVQKDSTLR
ncbi:MAG: heavy-metal-associated domain-containing protein [Candidatus Kapaibacteriales bacterium]